MVTFAPANRDSWVTTVNWMWPFVTQVSKTLWRKEHVIAFPSQVSTRKLCATLVNASMIFWYFDILISTLYRKWCSLPERRRVHRGPRPGVPLRLCGWLAGHSLWSGHRWVFVVAVSEWSGLCESIGGICVRLCDRLYGCQLWRGSAAVWGFAVQQWGTVLDGGGGTGVLLRAGLSWREMWGAVRWVSVDARTVSWFC